MDSILAALRSVANAAMVCSDIHSDFNKAIVLKYAQPYPSAEFMYPDPIWCSPIVHTGASFYVPYVREYTPVNVFEEIEKGYVTFLDSIKKIDRIKPI